jgi:hypothetical protein
LPGIDCGEQGRGHQEEEGEEFHCELKDTPSPFGSYTAITKITQLIPSRFYVLHPTAEIVSIDSCWRVTQWFSS